ncbi:helix-turn-helix transcriptional regulator [Staphylococcus warneri]|uniref:helix-turn-helix transcriptional regulator n=1 Tax=Staphylococcus warneri TaxID=1292 RepID=UPI00103E78F5|nr:AraC family transcriptional regulator [Staphylococcus warneri]MDK4264748.1 AraC family transcriptional regulator [Staphylococcus warneri]TBW80503.1 AraC family transcriptional regulator [Staphylococcus warneri]
MIENYSVRIFQNLIINNSKESNIKLIYWLKGTGNMIVNLKKYEMWPGRVLLVMMNDVYQIKSENQAITCLIEVSTKDFLRFVTPRTRLIGGEIPTSNYSKITDLLTKLIEIKCMNQTEEMMIDKIIKYLCIELCSIASDEKGNQGISLISEPIHNYLVDNHSRKINKNELVNATNVPSHQLTQMFQHTPYYSFNQYLNHIRLKFCLIDILSTDQSIEFIAINHGFNHYSRFIKLFKDAYGQTPKLIRKLYIETSISNNKTKEIKLDESILRLLNHVNKDNQQSSMMIDVHFPVSKQRKRIVPHQLYIEVDKLITLSHFDLLKLKEKLNYRCKPIHIIIEVELTSLIKQSKVFEEHLNQRLKMLNDVNMIPVYKIKTEHSDELTSIEKIAIQKLIKILFQIKRRFKNEKLEVLIRGINIDRIKEFKQLLNVYFDDYQLIWSPYQQQLNMIDKAEKLVDMIMIPLNKVSQFDFIKNEKLMISNLIEGNHTYFIKQSHFKQFKDIFKQLKNVNAVCLHWDDIDMKDIQFSQITSTHSILFLLDIYNQLRGKVIFENANLIVSHYRNEYQCIALLDIPMTKNPNIDFVQFNFANITNINHAEINMIDYQPFMKSTKGDRKSDTSEIKTENLYWIGEICKKEIGKNTIQLPSIAMVHINILVNDV